MKDFQLRNDTKLLFRNDPTADLALLATGKKVPFQQIPELAISARLMALRLTQPSLCRSIP